MNMRIRTFVCIVLLWSSNIFAKIDLNNTIPTGAFTTTNNAFIDESSVILIENMPPVNSQDSIGNCYGCSSATIAQKFICDNDDKIHDCNQTPIEKRISQLSMMAWAETNNPSQKAGLRSNHTNLKLGSQVTGNALGSNSLRNSMNLFSFIPESCYPFDQLVNKYGNNSTLVDQMLARVENIYNINKSTESEAPCLSCLEEINNDLNTNLTEKSFALALTKESFGEFLYSIIFSNCEPMRFRKKPNFGAFPENSKTTKKTEAIDVIKKILSSKKPIQLENICLRVDKNKPECQARHSTVVSGFRNVCSDKLLKNCKTQLKIQNCWGLDWQTNFDDGWVDADSLIKNVSYGKDTLDAATISWLY
jgi:hypothetical protein